MKKIKYFMLILMTSSIGASYAQQQVMFTQYMFNGLAINPAYAGSHEAISVTGLARKQWSGLDGAPVTETFSIHSPIKNQKMSLGLLMLHDKIGVTEQTGVYGSYAYRIAFNENAKLALGLQAGVDFYSAQYSKVSTTDPTFANGDIRESHPTFGFGIYYNTRRFYAGLSAPQLNQFKENKNNPDSDSKMIRHYFFTTGYVFDLSPSLKLKPNILVKAVNGAPVEVDLNANLLIQDVVWVGISWRSFDSYDALLQIQLTDQLQFGYSYDFATTTALSRVNNGSHEIMVNYRFSFNRNRVITPRYF